MNKPIIGIVGKPVKKNNEDLWYRNSISDEIRCLIVRYGGIAISLLPTEDRMLFSNDDTLEQAKLTAEELKDLENQLMLCDGIILQGGPTSNKYEVEIAKKAIELDKPMIGICAGFNNILRAIGSDVIENKYDNHDVYDINYRHDVFIKENTLLYKIVEEATLSVNSIHKMVATKSLVEPFAKITSTSVDGLVESFELENKSFILAIKWHPELMEGESYVGNLFSEFIKKCY